MQIENIIVTHHNRAIDATYYKYGWEELTFRW